MSIPLKLYGKMISKCGFVVVHHSWPYPCCIYTNI